VYRTIVATVALIVVASAAARAAEVPATELLTLDRAVQRVRQVGFDVRMARGEATIAAADAATARAALRPQISISGVALAANEPQLGMPVARQAYGAASLTLPLYTPSTRFTARAAATNAQAARTAVAASESDTVLLVVQTYRGVQLAAAVFDARQTDVRDQEQHLALTRARVDAGKAARYTLARDRAGLAVAMQAAEDAAAERDEKANDLAALLDLPIDRQIAVEPLAKVTFLDSRGAMLARALQQRPEYAAAQFRVAAARSVADAARSAYFPTAQLTAQTYNGGSTPALGSAGGQIGLTVSLPVVDGGSRTAAIVRARGELDRATAARDQLRVGIQRDVANAYRELEAAQKNIDTARAAQTDAEEQLRVARLRESSGKGVELEVLDALSVAATSRETVLRSLARYDDAVALLHHAVGDRTSSNPPS
jgi:outer membrane protein